MTTVTTMAIELRLPDCALAQRNADDADTTGKDCGTTWRLRSALQFQTYFRWMDGR